jgi:predicted alpha/beta superfamily hydrolase
MSREIGRREVLAVAGGLAATASVPAMAVTSKTSPGTFQLLPMPVESVFPRTRYFEVDSVRASARYAVWVTTPKIYDKDATRSFPAVYAPDGNWFVPLSPLLSDLGQWDFLDHFQSTIQVCVGYAGKDVDLALAVRARDLLPPNEPLPPGIEAGVQNLDPSLLDKAGAELYLRNLKNPAADRFLAFLSEELHPFLMRNYRIKADELGLFGHSYGGLFATYAALQGSTIFRNFGASSPGIYLGQSNVYKLYADAIAAGGLSDRNLHMTVGTRELTVPSSYQYMVAGGAIEFIRTVGTKPLKGLHFTSQLIENESHMTLMHPGACSFMREFYRV